MAFGRSGRLDVTVDANDLGLPVVGFTGEDGVLGDERRSCRVDEIRAGKLDFIMEAPRAWRRPGRYGLRGVVALSLLAGVAAFLIPALALDYGIGIRPYDVRDSVWAVIIPVILVTFGLAGAAATAALQLRGKIGGRIVSAWTELESFVLTDGASLYALGLGGNKERHLHVIVADFGMSMRPFEVIATSAPLASMQELHRILTREFVERRDALVRGLAAGDRGKVLPFPLGVSDRPERL